MALSEVIYTHLAQRFSNAQKGADELCPGEESCPRFESQGGAGISQAEQERAACTSCSLLKTKYKRVENEEGTYLLQRIERLIDQGRVSGIEWESLSVFEYEALIEYQRLHAMFLQANSGLRI